jgi:hypothetical protein
MAAVAAVLLIRLFGPLSMAAALLIAWLLARTSGRFRVATILGGSLAISAGVSLFSCWLQEDCRQPFDGQGIVIWLIGAVASACHLLIAFAVVDWLRRRAATRP